MTRSHETTCEPVSKSSIERGRRSAALDAPDLISHSLVEVGEECDCICLEIADDEEAVTPGHLVGDLERLDDETGRCETGRPLEACRPFLARSA